MLDWLMAWHIVCMFPGIPFVVGASGSWIVDRGSWLWWCQASHLYVGVAVSSPCPLRHPCRCQARQVAHVGRVFGACVPTVCCLYGVCRIPALCKPRGAVR